jgi:chromosome segregation ATPase
LSFGSGRSTSSRSTKGSSQKKVRRKKQEYHTRKVRKLSLETDQPGLAALKERTILSLEKLGTQKFASEPGGYSFQNWLTSFNLLLDDFEEKVGRNNLPREFFERRLSVVDELLKPVDVSDLEAEIRKCQDEQREIELKLMTADANRETNRRKEVENDASSIEALKAKRGKIADELEKERKELAEKKDHLRSASFFKKIFSGTTTTSISISQRKVDSLQEQLRDIDREIGNLQKRKERNATQINAPPDYEEEQSIAALRSRIAELEEQKLERLQILDKRKSCTKEMASAIVEIKVPESSLMPGIPQFTVHEEKPEAKSQGGGEEEEQQSSLAAEPPQQDSVSPSEI